MGRKPAPQPLALPGSSSGAAAAANDPPSAETAFPGASLSPADSRSPESARSSPLSIPSSRFAASTKRPQTAAPRSAQQQPADDSQQLRSQTAHGEADSPYPSMPSALPQQQYHQQQPAGPPPDSVKLRHAYADGKKASKSGFFHFNKASKTSNQLQPNVHQLNNSRSQVVSRGSDGTGTSRPGDNPYPDNSLERPVLSHPSRSDLSLPSTGDYEPTSASAPTSARKTPKPKPFGLLTRTKSTRDKNSHGSPREPTAPLPAASANLELRGDSAPLRTAPVAQERAFREMMTSSNRNRSEDRAPTRAPTREMAPSRESHRDNHRAHSSSRENGGSFLSGLRNSSTRAADMISKGLFGKSSRSGTFGDEKHTVDDEQYVIKVINRPLVEQTRITRISKRLETSRDKTEFWMPAFPWRAIDYLNYKGCDVEGLYRVPGSGPQIKRWQRRFDEEHDVNLFEEEDLYDINIVGSMLKAWLRELPDELFPKAAQERVARECAGSGTEEVPQMLIDELSKLPPFNYYLLFAITCHLSLLLAHSDKNKMDFRNLCICFQPCMKIDAFSFKFLVCDWRDCWKGCANEAKYIEEEYRLFDLPPPRSLTTSTPSPRPSEAVEVNGQAQSQEQEQEGKHGRKLSTSGSSKHSAQSNGEQKSSPKPKPLPLSGSNASIGSSSTISTALTANSERDHIGTTADLRPLSPIKPLSPIGFGLDSP